MIQALLSLFKIITLTALSVTAIVLLIFTIREWKQKKGKYVFLPLTVLSVGLFFYIANIGIFEAESTDREELVGTFEDNFGFAPPPSIHEIKVKNFTLYDAVAHWMAFTYDSLTFDKILAEDTTIKVGGRNSPEFIEAMDELRKDNPNYPRWFKIPEENINKIHYKKDFMNHSHSRYYMWVDKETNMVYLEVSYFY